MSINNIKRFFPRITFLFLFLAIQVQAECNNKLIYPDSLRKNRLCTVIGLETGAYLSGLSYLRYIWYRNHERVPFHFYNDSKGYLQIDKASHAFITYYESYTTYHALRWSGLNKNKSLLWGGATGLLFQIPIEIFDGIYEGWGFSWSDIAANTFGSLLFVSQEALFDKQIIRMKFSYSPSGYPAYHSILGESPLESFFLDYNAHTYWLSVNIHDLTRTKTIPNWLNIALGYSANGMIYEFHNPEYYRGKPFPHLERYRQYILSADIDWTKIKTDKKWLKTLFYTLNLIKFPFPAMEYNRINGLKMHWLYF